MQRISLPRLLYLAAIAREGSLVRAARALGTTHSNLSMQMHALEEELGGALFVRQGRSLVLSALGHEVVWYAEEIARLAEEVADVPTHHDGARRSPLRVGIVGTLPKALAFRLLEPALAVPGTGPLVARQDTDEKLHEELAAGRLHLVLSDSPPPQGGSLRLFAHVLGASAILLFGSRKLATQYGSALPGSLQDAPLLLPARGSGLRRGMDRWLTDQGLRVKVEGEFDDAGLLRLFGLRGRGLFPVRDALRAEAEDLGGVVCLGALAGLTETYFLISVERRVRHPAASVVIESARSRLVTAIGARG